MTLYRLCVAICLLAGCQRESEINRKDRVGNTSHSVHDDGSAETSLLWHDWMASDMWLHRTQVLADCRDMTGKGCKDEWSHLLAKNPKALTIVADRTSICDIGKHLRRSANLLISLHYENVWELDKQEVNCIARIRPLLLSLASPTSVVEVAQRTKSLRGVTVFFVDDLPQLPKAIQAIATDRTELSAWAPHLPYLENLRLVHLERCECTKASIADLARLPNLKYISLRNSLVGYEQITGLPAIAKLTHLDLEGTLVSDNGLETMAQLKQIKVLMLWRTEMTDKGLAALRQKLPNAEIYPTK